MTTIITRLFPDEAAAQSAAARLQFKGIPKNQCDVIVAGDNATKLMERAEVHESAIGPYGQKLAGGNAVLVVRTTYKPLGAAKLTREILGARDVINMGDIVDDFFVPSQSAKTLSILQDHPHFLTLPGVEVPHGPITSGFGVPILKPRKNKRVLMDHDKRMSRMFWPMPLLSKKNRSSSVMHGGRQMSKAFWPTPLISRKHRQKSVIPGGGFPFSRLLNLRTTR